MIVKKIFLVAVLAFTVMVPMTNVFGHGNPGVDRAPPINFENQNVTVEIRMKPSDMTVGDFSNSFMSIAFLNDDTEELIPQTTYKVDVFKKDKLLARNMFYAEDGKVTIDIRPNENCSVDEDKPWQCATYYGTKHPISAGALYTLGENNPVIWGAIFTEGGLYHMDVEVISAGSVRSNLLEPLEFDLYVTIAQEQVFFITVPDNLLTQDL